MKKQRQKIIAIVGPTASGKTALGLYLAKKLGGEIISADSRQIYRGMDVIAGVPSKKEAGAIPYHLVRTVAPGRQQSAGQFSKKAKKLIDRIYHIGRIPIVVGGTGFWADALLRGLSLPEVPPNTKLRTRLQKKKVPSLFAELKRLDPTRAKNIDPHNTVRLIRAIEIARALGSVPRLTSVSSYDVLWLGLAPKEKDLQKAVRARIRSRLCRGMRAEACRLRGRMSAKRFRALGAEFSLLSEYLDGTLSTKELGEKLVAWELSYAKRQMRWYRKHKDIHWFPSSSRKNALFLATRFLKEH